MRLTYLLFILLFLFLTLIPVPRVYAENEAVQAANPSESQIGAEDTTPPVISSVNVTDQQALSGITSLEMTVNETNLSEYSIRVYNPDDSATAVDGTVVQNPAAGAGLAFDWDTTKLANGDYRIVFSASDQAGNVSTPVEVTVKVLNSNGEPAYPPITPVLTPVVVPGTITPASPRSTPPAQPSQGGTDEADSVPTKKDVLAARIQDSATAAQKVSAPPSATCALFFGTCWYWSVPGTVVIVGIAYGAYRFRNRIA
jgi:hypothetical protein